MRVSQLSCAAVAIAAVACQFGGGFDGNYRCGDDAGACPAGLVCSVDGLCRDPVLPDATLVDAAVDPSDAGTDGRTGGDAGEVDFCEEAAGAGPADSCTDGDDRDLTAAARAAGGVTVYGDTSGYANHLASPASYCDEIGVVATGKDAIYTLRPEPGEQIIASLETDAWDSVLYLTPLCDTNDTCNAGADATFDTVELSQPVEEVVYTAGDEGLLYLLVDSIGGSYHDGCFRLRVRIE